MSPLRLDRGNGIGELSNYSEQGSQIYSVNIFKTASKYRYVLYLVLFAFTTIIFKVAQACYCRHWVGWFYAISSVAIFSLAVIAGCRDNTIGTDIHVYALRTFEAAKHSESLIGGYKSVKGISEFGYYLLNYISSIISAKFGVSLFFQSLLITSLVFFGVKDIVGVKHIALGMLLFNLYFYSLTLNLMRQGIAIAFVFWSYRFFQERKLHLLLLCAIIGYYLHKTSVIAYVIILALYWITSKDIKHQKRWLIISATISVLGVVLFGAILTYITQRVPLFEKYSAYGANSAFGSALSTLDIILRLGIFTACLYLLQRRLCESRKCLVILFFLIVDIAAQLLGVYAFFTTRIGYYFFACEIILFSSLISNSNGVSSRTKSLANFALITFLTVYCIRMYYVKGDCATYPYTSDFLGIA